VSVLSRQNKVCVIVWLCGVVRLPTRPTWDVPRCRPAPWQLVSGPLGAGGERRERSVGSGEW
jgi:hypothetical protein